MESDWFRDICAESGRRNECFDSMKVVIKESEASNKRRSEIPLREVTGVSLLTVRFSTMLQNPASKLRDIKFHCDSPKLLVKHTGYSIYKL